MKRTALRYGLYSAIILTGLMSLSLFLSPRLGLNYDDREVVGYLSIFLSMIFIFLGIRYYRNQNNGYLSFGQGLKLGVLMALLPAVLFGLFNMIYGLVNPHFFQDYANYYIEDMRRTMPAKEFEVEKAAFLKKMDFLRPPLMQFLVMAITVFVIGFIVAIISSLALQRKPQVNVAM